MSQVSPESSIAVERPFDFSTGQEVAFGALFGAWAGSVGFTVLGGLIGLFGASFGKLVANEPIIGGWTFLMALLWLPALALALSTSTYLRFGFAIGVGAIWVMIGQWYIGNKDIGDFYRWILVALPMGVVFGTCAEVLWLAHGGKISVDPNYSHRAGATILLPLLLNMVAILLTLGRRRYTPAISGLLAGGLGAAPASAIVAWRGDAQVADLFFGSVWNIAWAFIAIGAVAGLIAGWLSVQIHERQETLRERALNAQE